MVQQEGKEKAESWVLAAQATGAKGTRAQEG